MRVPRAASAFAQEGRTAARIKEQYMHGSHAVVTRALPKFCLAALLTAALPGCGGSSSGGGAGSGSSSTQSAPGGSPGGPTTTTASWSCNFPDAPTNCGFFLQAAAPDRAMIIGPGRSGPTAVELTTEPGDINLFGGGTAERADLALAASSSYCNQGQEEWWAHSLMFPGGYVIPVVSVLVWNWGVVFDFHHTGSGGQPNFQIASLPTGLELWVAGGPTAVTGPGDPGLHRVAIGPVQFNIWYDFVYHVRWSSGSDGYFQAWLDGRQVMNYSGPTLYAGQSCYLKLADYHTALGLPVSVIHSRVIRGATQAEVQLPGT